MDVSYLYRSEDFLEDKFLRYIEKLSDFVRINKSTYYVGSIDSTYDDKKKREQVSLLKELITNDFVEIFQDIASFTDVPKEYIENLDTVDFLNTADENINNYRKVEIFKLFMRGNYV